MSTPNGGRPTAGPHVVLAGPESTAGSEQPEPGFSDWLNTAMAEATAALDRLQSDSDEPVLDPVVEPNAQAG